MTKVTKGDGERCGSGYFALKSSKRKRKSLKSNGFEAFQWQREKDSNPHIRSQSFDINRQKTQRFQYFQAPSGKFVTLFVTAVYSTRKVNI